MTASNLQEKKKEVRKSCKANDVQREHIHRHINLF